MAFGARVILDPGSRILIQKLNPAQIQWSIIGAMKDFVTLLIRKLKDRSPQSAFKPGKQGHFRRSWAGDAKDGKIIITNDVGYAPFVEFPTRPHLISPKNKPFLAWRTGGRGPISSFKVSKSGAGASKNWIFTTKPVRHPGTKGQFIFKRTLRDFGHWFGRYFNKRVLSALGFNVEVKQ
jgi:hypothetical protein